MYDCVALSGGCSKGSSLVGSRCCGFCWGTFFGMGDKIRFLFCSIDGLFCVGAKELSFADWLGQGVWVARGGYCTSGGYCNFFGNVLRSAFLDR